MDDPDQQQELSLPFPEFSGDLPLLPVRMVNEYQYCPRLAYLEWVQTEWAESGDTVEGRHTHRRVDQRNGDLPIPGVDSEGIIHARSITLSSNHLGLMVKLDLVEGENDRVTPVEYKRGKRPHVPRGAYDPERVQLCAQGLVLREHGYRCEQGIVYFATSRERVTVPFDDELVSLTQNAISGLRLIAAGGQTPPPLVDSPKCPRCSLNVICLPDEVNFFKGAELPPRPLFVAHDEALPVYVQANHAKVSKKGETLEIRVNDEKTNSVRLIDVSQLVLSGNVYVTTPTLQELMKRNIPVTWQSYGGWFMGHTIGTGHKNVELRTAQYRASFDDQLCLRLAKGFIEGKIRNSRNLLRRNWKSGEANTALVSDLQRDSRRTAKCHDLQELLGVEGAAAARYFGNFRRLLRLDATNLPAFDFTKRNRRPPTDPVNAMLSYAYSLLTRLCTVTLVGVGFDPYRGFYHQPRYGRPALALDIMEPFRPLVADSCVLQAINNGEVRPNDFIQAAASVNLTADGRKRLIAAFERRLSHEITHPLLGYRINYRRLIELQARLLGRFLLGDLPDYPNFTTR